MVLLTGMGGSRNATEGTAFDICAGATPKRGSTIVRDRIAARGAVVAMIGDGERRAGLGEAQVRWPWGRGGPV